MSGGGTFERIARELGLFLEPLPDWVGNEADFRILLASVGLDVEDVADLATLRGSLVPMLSLIDGLEATLQTLAAALASDPVDVASVRDAAETLVGDVRDAIDAIPGLATAVESLASGDAAHRQAVAADLVPRLVELLLILHVERRAPTLHRALRFLGVFEYTPVDADPTVPLPAHDRRRVRFARLGELLDPGVPPMERLFGWGTPGFDPVALFARLSDVGTALGLAIVEEPGQLPALRLGHALMTPAGDGLDLVFELTPDPASIVFPSGLPVDLALSVETAFNRRPTLEFRPGRAIRVRQQADSASRDIAAGGLDLVATWPAASATAEPLVILGELGGSRLEAERIDVGVGVDFRLNEGSTEVHPAAFARVRGGRLVIELAGGDGFVQTLAGDAGLAFDVDFGIGYDPVRGVHVLDGTGLEMHLPMHLQLGPIRLDEFILGLSPIAEGVRVEASTTLGGDFGILAFSLERVGVNIDLLFGTADDTPLDVRASFRPPDGVGAVVDASGVSGGGYLYFDDERGEYAGVLELAFAGLSLQAIGLLSTRTPAGEDAFSFLAIVTARFKLPLGYGFTLNGVGGILGVDRATDVDALRAGLRNGALGSVLFPEDPVANAPQLLQNLGSFFPSTEGRHLFGPMLAIGWGAPVTILEIQLGVVLELPAPIRVLLLGRIVTNLPHEDASVVRLNLDLLGIIDTGRQEISIDASLHDSEIVGFPLFGDMAMRLGYGRNPTFAMSLGGFHPRFTPPANFPVLRRLTLSLSAGDNPRLRLDLYAALTSNTVQIGSSVELHAAALGFSLEGGLAFDALFQFNPFGFVVDFRAYLAIKRGSTHILSLSAAVSLSGVSPWRIEGRASFKVLFVRVRIPFSKSFGDAAPAMARERTDVAALLLEQLRDTRNWDAALPDGTVASPVSLRDAAGGENELAVHPLGAVTVLQKLVPLGILIERFGQAVPINGERFELERDVEIGAGNARQTLTAEIVSEHFAPAEFFDLDDDEKLERPSFETEAAGLRVGGGFTASNGVSRVVDHEEVLIDRRHRQRYPLRLAGVTLGIGRDETRSDLAANRREILSLERDAGRFFGGRLDVLDIARQVAEPAPAVTVLEPDHVVVDADTLRASGGLEAADGVTVSDMRARERLRQQGGPGRGRRVTERFEVDLATRIARA